MISLRKHIDSFRETKADGGEVGSSPPDLTGSSVSEPVVSEFMAVLLAICECASRAVPNMGVELNRNITRIRNSLVQPVTTDLLTATGHQARAEISNWADRSLSHHQDIQRELCAIVSVAATAAESMTERDEKYVKEFGGLTSRLGSMAKETDLAVVRGSLAECTRSLKSCVARMAEEGKASVSHLTEQVKEYRTRLEEAERVSLADPLTNLANRRAFEKHLEGRIEVNKPFCLIMIDLNDFKSVNDRFGHMAGDDLLKQFAAELKAQFTLADMVGRLGGDEFIAIMAGSPIEARGRVERICKWALGEYKISSAGQSVKTLLRASLGMAAWDGKESGPALLARADQEVYRAKHLGRRADAVEPRRSVANR